MQITLGLDVDVDHPVTGNLVEHVVKKWHTGCKLALTGTVEIETHSDLGLQRIASDFSLPHEFLQKKAAKGFRLEGHDTISAQLWLSVNTP
jgi:hypothetical protein